MPQAAPHSAFASKSYQKLNMSDKFQPATQKPIVGNPHSLSLRNQTPYPQTNIPSHKPPLSQPQVNPPSRTATISTPAKSAIRDLLPYCTTERPLTDAQVIGLSDVAGSLKEVMLLALQARTDERVARELVAAVGEEAATGIAEFWGDEFEIGGL